LSPVKRKALVATTIAVVLVATAGALYIYYATDLHLPPEYRWGREGTLKLDLALERTEISVNESLNYTVTITNVGKERVRLYMGYSGAWTSLLDDTNQTPRYFGPMMAPPPRPDDERFNSMMKVLEPGKNITQSGRYANHTAGGGYHDIQPGRTYHVIAGYSCSDERSYPALPHWQGELSSGAKYFTIRE